MHCINSLKVTRSLVAGGEKLLYEYIVRHPEAGPRAHKCTVCGKIGNDRGNLRKHVESLHFPGSFRYACKYCQEEFDTKTKLNNHVMRVCRKSMASFQMWLSAFYCCRWWQAAVSVYCDQSRDGSKYAQLFHLWQNWIIQEQSEDAHRKHPFCGLFHSPVQILWNDLFHKKPALQTHKVT